MNKNYIIGIYKISKQNNYIVAHTLYSCARKPVESVSICFVLRLGGLNPTSKQGIYFHFLMEKWRMH